MPIAVDTGLHLARFVEQGHQWVIGTGCARQCSNSVSRRLAVFRIDKTFDWRKFPLKVRQEFLNSPVFHVPSQVACLGLGLGPYYCFCGDDRAECTLEDSVGGVYFFG